MLNQKSLNQNLSWQIHFIVPSPLLRFLARLAFEVLNTRELLLELTSRVPRVERIALLLIRRARESDLARCLEELNAQSLTCVPCDMTMHQPALTFNQYIMTSEGPKICLLTPGLSVLNATTTQPPPGSVTTSRRVGLLYCNVAGPLTVSNWPLPLPRM